MASKADKLFAAYQQLHQSEQAKFVELLEQAGQVGARVTDAAWLLGVHPGTITHRVQNGSLPSNGKHGAGVRISIAAIVLSFLAKCVREEIDMLRFDNDEDELKRLEKLAARLTPQVALRRKRFPRGLSQVISRKSCVYLIS